MPDTPDSETPDGGTPDGDAPRRVLERFYAAERAYMAGDEAAGFDAMRATLAADVVLHQSPDLPFGGDYVGPDRYRDWAEAMRAIFDVVDVRDAEFFEREDAVVVVCRLVTRTRATGRVMDHPMAQVVRVRDGRITEFRPFYWNVPAYAAAATGGDRGD